MAMLFHARLPGPAPLARERGKGRDGESVLGIHRIKQSPPVALPPYRGMRGGRRSEEEQEQRRWHSVAGSRAFTAPECPPEPAPDYPMEFPIMNVTANWNPDTPEIPQRHYAGICRFDFQTQRAQADAYRRAEVPFIVQGVPSVEKTVAKWSDLRYLQDKLGHTEYLTEYSTNNHFMYFQSNGRGPAGWEPPVENRKMSFKEWKGIAKKADTNNISDTEAHYYFRVNSLEASFIRDDLTALTPRSEGGFFIVEPSAAKGIHCRFGMRGIVAAAHYDGSRNMVAILKGFRRYMLSDPKNCKPMHLYQRPHPSARHSEVDWSNPDLDNFPDFPKTRVNEVIMSPGDILYIPSGWIHYIMSINTNLQCNARSGKSKGGRAKSHSHELGKCGF